MKLKLLGIVWLVFFTAGVMSGGVVYPINQASTADFSQGTYSGLSARGWDFQANGSGVSVVQLGVNAATSIPITLTLWDDATQTELAQIVVDAVANSWVFGDLLTPIDLASSGHIYSVIGWADTTGGSAWYLFDNDPPSEFTPTGLIEYRGARYSNGQGADAFPGNYLGSPYQYGVTDIGYVQNTGVPEPVSFSLAAAGILLFCAARSRRSLS